MKDTYRHNCKDALQLLNIKTECGKDCPLFKKCPRLILEDATDEAIEDAITSLLMIVTKRNSNAKD